MLGQAIRGLALIMWIGDLIRVAMKGTVRDLAALAIVVKEVLIQLLDQADNDCRMLFAHSTSQDAYTKIRLPTYILPGL